MKINTKKQISIFKYAVNSFVAASILFAPIVSNVAPVINTAKAEVSCTDDALPIPTADMTVRKDNAQGEVLGTYHARGAIDSPDDPGNGETGVATFQLQVPKGTKLYFTARTDGFNGPNRSVGGMPNYSGGGVTVTSPDVKAGYYPNGFSFSRLDAVTGLSDRVINGPVSLGMGGDWSCWGGDRDSHVQLIVNVVTKPSTNLVTRTATTNLAVINDPAVSSHCSSANDPGNNSTCRVDLNDGATISWNAESTTNGNSCIATNDNTSSNPDSNWNGAKDGTSGTQAVGPFPSLGTFTYQIKCTGLNGVTSTPSTTTFIVGNTPSYTCQVVPSGIQQVDQGGYGAASLHVTSLSGYNKPVTFSPAIVSPSGAGSPQVTIEGNNPQNSPYATNSPVSIFAPANSAVGTYTITFKTEDGIVCDGNVTLQINSAADPDGYIYCGASGAQTTCKINGGDSIPIRWHAENVNNDCVVIATANDDTQFDFATGKDGNKSSGPLSKPTQFSLGCSASNGHQDLVRTAFVDITSICTVNCGTGMSLTASNSTCEQVNLSWSSTVNPAPKSYKLFRSLDGNTYAEFATVNDPTNTYVDRPPQQLGVSNYYKIQAYNDYNGNGSVVANGSSQVVPVPCATPSLEGSDKDVTNSKGKITKAFNPPPCNGVSDFAVLPNNAIFTAGDEVTFKINICNPADPNTPPQRADLTNITVEDTMHNLSAPTSIKSMSSNGGGTRGAPCLLSSQAQDNTDGDFTGFITFTVKDIPRANLGQYCSIIITAKIQAPLNPTASIYRFWNEAKITATGNGQTITKTVKTPLYPFGLTNVPNRNETSPH